MADPQMPILMPALSSSDIVTDPYQDRSQFRISEAHCERAVFIWELHDATFPAPTIPPKEIINTNDPDRDTSTSIFDVMGKVPSGRFIRGQEIKSPAEWQLHLQRSEHTNAAEVEILIVLTCEEILAQANKEILVKVAYEIIDHDYAVLWSSGDVYDSEVKRFIKGLTHTISLGKKDDLQNRRQEIMKNDILRFRVRLNIYKNLPAASKQKENENEKPPPTKRQRLEVGVPARLTDFLGSLESLWKNREQTGNITILCGGQEIKVHRFILTGRSKVFMEMLNNTKMDTAEQSSSVIKVTDIDPEVITSILEYLYLGTVSLFDMNTIDNVCALIYASDKYWISDLMTLCCQHLMRVMNLDNFAKIAKAVFTFDCPKKFKDEVRHFYGSNQMTLNDVDSFRKFAYDDFDCFHKLFFYIA